MSKVVRAKKTNYRPSLSWATSLFKSIQIERSASLLPDLSEDRVVDKQRTFRKSPTIQAWSHKKNCLDVSWPAWVDFADCGWTERRGGFRGGGGQCPRNLTNLWIPYDETFTKTLHLQNFYLYFQRFKGPDFTIFPGEHAPGPP